MGLMQRAETIRNTKRFPQRRPPEQARPPERPFEQAPWAREPERPFEQAPRPREPERPFEQAQRPREPERPFEQARPREPERPFEQAPRAREPERPFEQAPRPREPERPKNKPAEKSARRPPEQSTLRPPLRPQEQAPLRPHQTITFKFVSVIVLLLFLSQGAITVMISFLLSADVQLTAEDNNFSIGRRNAHSVSLLFNNIRSATRLFLFNPNPAGGAVNGRQLNTASFFAENPGIACIGVYERGGGGRFSQTASYPNMPLLASMQIAEEPLKQYIAAAAGAETAAAAGAGADTALGADTASGAAGAGADALFEQTLEGRVFVRNVSREAGAPLIAFFFPLTGRAAAAAFIPVTSILQNFGEGNNVTFLLNENADVLVHPDMSMVLGGANMRRIRYITALLDNNEKEIQKWFVDESGVKYIAIHQRIDLNDGYAEGSMMLFTIISTNSVLYEIVSIARRNIVFGFAMLLVSAVLVGLFSRTLTRPIKKLTEAARKIENGDYEYELSVDSKDEIGVLTESFISMRFSLENFQRFTNKALVNLARSGTLTRTGENKNATVCFMFIRDFAEMTEGLRARTVVEFVNEFLGRVIPCIISTGGIVDKFLTQNGIVIMAFWGTTDTGAKGGGEHALNCVRACLMARFALYELNEERFEQFWGHSPLIKMGCGINSGDLVVGQIGSETRMEYTVIGDTVNLAARLEGPNDVFDTDILISENTRTLLGGGILATEMPSIEVKGKEKPLRVYSVLNMGNISDSGNLFEEYRRIQKTETEASAGKKIKMLASIATVEQLRKILARRETAVFETAVFETAALETAAFEPAG